MKSETLARLPHRSTASSPIIPARHSKEIAPASTQADARPALPDAALRKAVIEADGNAPAVTELVGNPDTLVYPALSTVAWLCTEDAFLSSACSAEAGFGA